MKHVFTLLMLLYTNLVFAMPKHFEVWFLSNDSTAFLDNIQLQKKYSTQFAQSYLQCQPMGEYCFDPQVGLYKPDEKGKVQEEMDYSLTEKMEVYNDLPVSQSIDRELITCDKGIFFDIFCGEAKVAKESDIKLQIWVDVSSTMKQVDGALPNDICGRQRFINAVESKCPLNQKLDVHIFTESKKQIDTVDRVCLSYGLNEVERLMKQIEESTVDHLIIITDIFEASQRFISFIENTPKGSHRGIDSPFTAKDMLQAKQKIISYCQ